MYTFGRVQGGLFPPRALRTWCVPVKTISIYLHRNKPDDGWLLSMRKRSVQNEPRNSLFLFLANRGHQYAFQVCIPTLTKLSLIPGNQINELGPCNKTDIDDTSFTRSLPTRLRNAFVLQCQWTQQRSRRFSFSIFSTICSKSRLRDLTPRFWNFHPEISKNHNYYVIITKYWLPVNNLSQNLIKIFGFLGKKVKSIFGSARLGNEQMQFNYSAATTILNSFVLKLISIG